jgi:peptidoglycan/xylan/chitin deacetylase (PgdA/CDA1 family)
VLVLQCHPDQWADDTRWKWFTEIIDYLQSQGCRFMTPSEYQQSLEQTK